MEFIIQFTSQCAAQLLDFGVWPRAAGTIRREEQASANEHHHEKCGMSWDGGMGCRSQSGRRHDTLPDGHCRVL